MQEKFDKYWTNMKDFAAINQVFDPCCKLEKIKFILSEELGKPSAAKSIQNIEDILTTWFNKVISN